MWNPRLTVNTSISYERKHASDLSMLVFCFRGHTLMVYLRATKVHNNSVFKELTLHFLLQKSQLWNPPNAFGFPIVNPPPPMPSEFHNREPPSPSEIQKAVRGIGMDIFWNRPFPHDAYNAGPCKLRQLLSKLTF